jgi:hypothetical protein
MRAATFLVLWKNLWFFNYTSAENLIMYAFGVNSNNERPEKKGWFGSKNPNRN